jgi:hypothetical protein
MPTPIPAPLDLSTPYQALVAQVASGRPDPAALEGLLADLDRHRNLEQAWLLLRLGPADPAPWAPWLARIKTILERDRPRRMTAWQIDPDRTTLRLRFAVAAPACGGGPAALALLLAGALLEAGLPVSVGLEKALRPAIHLGHPLPPGVAGRSEWADAALAVAPRLAAADLPDRINARAPAGLRILACEAVPNHGSPVSELCRRARWGWACPGARREAAGAALERFAASDRFEIEKTGKVEGHKEAKRIDIRPLLEPGAWVDGEYRFATAAGPGEATNPRRLLSAIAGWEVPPEELARLELELAEDPRLAQGDKFQPKLRNMFEDAVALGAGGNIRLVEDDDDDEPLVLG